LGYTYKFIVGIDGQKVSFELDEQNNFRAIIPYEDITKFKSQDTELLKVISETIKTIFH
jgi:hypothetical protein